MKSNSKGARRSRGYQEYQACIEAQSGQEPLIKYEGGGVIAPNEPKIIDLSKSVVPIDI